MLKKIAAALIAATMLTAPVLIAGTGEAAAATAQTATPAKPGIKAVKKHRKHVRHAARHGAKYVKVVRNGKVVYVKARSAKHSMKHVKRPMKQGTHKARAA
jgi:CubicO group peptidase (beta-lactamase class C family)